jgi:hypothetical protein
LRAVLHYQQHAVASLDTAFVLQMASDAFSLVLESGVAQRRVVEDDEGLVRVTCRRHLDIMEKVGLWQRQLVRNAGRPELEMPIARGGHRVRRGLVWRASSVLTGMRVLFGCGEVMSMFRSAEVNSEQCRS